MNTKSMVMKPDQQLQALMYHTFNRTQGNCSVTSFQSVTLSNIHTTLLSFKFQCNQSCINYINKLDLVFLYTCYYKQVSALWTDLQKGYCTCTQFCNFKRYNLNLWVSYWAKSYFNDRKILPSNFKALYKHKLSYKSFKLKAWMTIYNPFANPVIIGETLCLNVLCHHFFKLENL